MAISIRDIINSTDSIGYIGSMGYYGSSGYTGSVGLGVGFNYTFSTNTTSADPGSGFFRFNSATLSSITEMYISDLDNDGINRSSAFLTFDDVAGVNKATIYIPGYGTGFNSSITVTGTITDNGTWLTIPVTFDTGALPGNNGIRNIIGVRNGDVGYIGSQGNLGPLGPLGPIGPIGAIGYTGSRGNLGPLGPLGPIGPIGPLGYTGSQGIGPIGPIGPLGYTGSVGTQGPLGPLGPLGPVGSQGPLGPLGYTGSVGTQGPLGPLGPIGPVGSQGPLGPLGYTGSLGNQGPLGPVGSQGPLGPLGYTGSLGNQGPLGPFGPAGYTGSIGSGPIGPIGPVGTIGYTGSAGGGASTVPVTYTFGGYGTPSTGTNKTPYLRASIGSTCQSASLVAKTAPVIGPFQVQILRSADGGATFPNFAAYINLPAGSKVATTSLSTVLSTGDLLRFDILSVNTASDWTCQLYTTI